LSRSAAADRQLDLSADGCFPNQTHELLGALNPLTIEFQHGIADFQAGLCRWTVLLHPRDFDAVFLSEV
jgi:hypothetical protein